MSSRILFLSRAQPTAVVKLSQINEKKVVKERHEILRNQGKFEVRDEASNPGTGNRCIGDRHRVGRDSDPLDDGARVGDHHSLCGVNAVPDRISHIFGHCRREAGETTREQAQERWAKGMRDTRVVHRTRMSCPGYQEPQRRRPEAGSEDGWSKPVWQ